MPKKEWEYAAKDRFLAHLKRTKGEEWRVLSEDYRVNEQTCKDFDFQLGFDGRRMALELFRLTDNGPTIAAQYAWIEIVTLIEKEFEARGIIGLAMNTPPYFSIPKARDHSLRGRYATSWNLMSESFRTARKLVWRAFK